MKTVVLPSCIERVGDNAFEGCTNLEVVVLDAAYIGSNAFSGCKNATIYTHQCAFGDEWNVSALSDCSNIIYNYDGNTHTYTLNGGQYNDGDTVVSKYAIILPELYCEGVTFGGWYASDDFSGEASTAIYYATSDVTLYAKWTAVELSSVADGSDMDSAIELKLNTPATVNITQSGQEVYFKFTSSEAGKYTFTSVGEYDTYGKLCNVYGDSIDSSSGGLFSDNFIIERTLEADTIYYLIVSVEGDEATFNISVTK